MYASNYNPIQVPVLSEKAFHDLSEFIHSHYGIKLPPEKKLMLQSRLQRRLKTLGYQTFDDYCRYVFSSEGEDEVIHMINRVTTNKTDFFREPGHFDFLVETLLPLWLTRHHQTPNRPFALWSAGCSTGEEPYTLAMILSDFQKTYPAFDFKIFASDISSQVLEKAREAIYNKDRIAPITMEMRRKYLLKSRDPEKSLVRIVPELRRKIRFDRVNLMEPFRMKEKFDVIFCRNVIIYFNRQTQEKLINQFARQLQPKGYLFLGHSESINGMSVPFVTVAPTVYQKQ